jgi:hypothetical protein
MRSPEKSVKAILSVIDENLALRPAFQRSKPKAVLHCRAREVDLAIACPFFTDERLSMGALRKIH